MKAADAIPTDAADQVPYVPLCTADQVYAVGKGIAFEGSGVRPSISPTAAGSSP